MIKKLIILSGFSLSSLIFATSTVNDFDFDCPFDKVCSRIADMQKEIENTITTMFNNQPGKTFTDNTNSSMPSIEQDEKNVFVSVKAPDIDHEKIEIKKVTDPEEDYLTITIPDKSYSIEIIVTPYEIAYSSKRTVKEEKTTKDDNKAPVVYYSYGSSIMRQSLPCEVSLGDVKAEYKEGLLTISLTKVDPKKNIQIIPVTKK